MQSKTISTPFGDYFIVERRYNGRPARLLMSDHEVPQSGLALDDEPDQLFMYSQRFMEVALSVQPSRVLVIGGGGFTVPSALARQLGVIVDAVEINPTLPEVARDYFDIATPEEGLTVHVADGASYISSTNEQYDLIVVDAFSHRTIPETLISDEAMQSYARILLDDGVLAFNCISRYHTTADTVLKRLLNAVDTTFSWSAVYPAEYGFDKRSDQNLIVLASRDKQPSLDYLQSVEVTPFR